MESKNVKEEIINFFLNEIAVSSNFRNEETATIRYCKGLDLMLSKENDNRKKEFITVYCTLLQKTDFPVLKVYTVVQLFKKWLTYPRIISHIDFLISKSKMKLMEDEFWVQILVSIESDNKRLSLQQARLKLLIIALNSGLFNQEELVTRGDVISSILRLHINEENQLKIKSGLKEKSHPYYRMFFIIRNMMDANLSKIELNELIKMHFWSPDLALPFNETFKTFYKIMNQNLSNSFLNQLNNLEIKKLYNIYTIRPSLFDELSIDSNQPLQFRLIFEALFENFMISGVFLSSYLKDKINLVEKEWFFEEVRGVNIINVKTLPFKLTKKAAHNFRLLPKKFDVSVSEGLVYSSIFTLTDDHDYSLACARAIRDVFHADYWIKTMPMLHKQGLTTFNVINVMDYINAKVFIDGVSIGLKNKSIKNILADVTDWHRQLRAERELKLVRSRRLADAGFDDFETIIDDKMFVIRQLKLSIDLFDEGNDLHHCVYSYRSDCFNGNSYIFSLRELDENLIENRLITIEVRGDRVCQSKGRYNCAPTKKEKEIISIWSKENNLIFNY